MFWLLNKYPVPRLLLYEWISVSVTMWGLKCQSLAAPTDVEVSSNWGNQYHIPISIFGKGRARQRRVALVRCACCWCGEGHRRLLRGKEGAVQAPNSPRSEALGEAPLSLAISSLSSSCTWTVWWNVCVLILFCCYVFYACKAAAPMSVIVGEDAAVVSLSDVEARVFFPWILHCIQVELALPSSLPSLHGL